MLGAEPRVHAPGRAAPRPSRHRGQRPPHVRRPPSAPAMRVDGVGSRSRLGRQVGPQHRPRRAVQEHPAQKERQPARPVAPVDRPPIGGHADLAEEERLLGAEVGELHPVVDPARQPRRAPHPPVAERIGVAVAVAHAGKLAGPRPERAGLHPPVADVPGRDHVRSVERTDERRLPRHPAEHRLLADGAGRVGLVHQLPGEDRRVLRVGNAGHRVDPADHPLDVLAVARLAGGGIPERRQRESGSGAGRAPCLPSRGRPARRRSRPSGWRARSPRAGRAAGPRRARDRGGRSSPPPSPPARSGTRSRGPNPARRPRTRRAPRPGPARARRRPRPGGSPPSARAAAARASPPRWRR